MYRFHIKICSSLTLNKESSAELKTSKTPDNVWYIAVFTNDEAGPKSSSEKILYFPEISVDNIHFTNYKKL